MFLNRKIDRLGKTILVLVIVLVTLGIARGHGTHVEKDDACTITKEVKTKQGTYYQWCDLDGDSDAELIQEIIYSFGGAHYLDIFPPRVKGL
jgi:hypothetical protein